MPIIRTVLSIGHEGKPRNNIGIEVAQKSVPIIRIEIYGKNTPKVRCIGMCANYPFVPIIRVPIIRSRLNLHFI